MKLTVFKREDGVVLLGYPPIIDERIGAKGDTAPEVIKPGEGFVGFTT